VVLKLIRKSELLSLDIVLNRLFRKLFKTNNIDTVQFCQHHQRFVAVTKPFPSAADYSGMAASVIPHGKVGLSVFVLDTS